MNQQVALPIAVVLVASVVAAVTDVWRFKVHNWLTVPLMLSGLIYREVTGGWEHLTDGAWGVMLGFGVLLIFYLMGGMGAGDVKLMAGVGAWLGFQLTLVVFLASALAAGEPAHVARYAFQLAQAFANFYEKYPILHEENREKKVFLLWMTEFFRRQLERTATVLGIEVPDYM